MQNDDTPDGEMSHMDFMRAQFFIAGEAATPEPVNEIAALDTFVQALDQMPPVAQRAAIGWLADRYLGIGLTPKGSSRCGR